VSPYSDTHPYPRLLHTPNLLLNFGAVLLLLLPGAVPPPLLSKSAAHKAAPTWFVNVKKIFTTGTVSSSVATNPKLVYAAAFCSTNLSRCEADQPFSWK